MVSSIRSRLARTIVLGICVAGILAGASFAVAASVSLLPKSGPPTTKTTATGSGFSSGETVSVTFDTAILGTATTDSAGNFTVDVRDGTSHSLATVRIAAVA